MGLRKTTKKIFSMLKLYFKYYFNIRSENQEPNNFADEIILNPNISHHIKIPKIIWMYWDNETPEIVERCIQQIRMLNKQYVIRELNTSNLEEYCKIDFSKFKQLTPQLKSDLIRLHLLYVYGGIWLDASIITYQNLDWIEQRCIKNNTHFFGYYRQANTTVKTYPVIESWLLATEKSNSFFKQWYLELEYAIHSGIKNYIQEIKTKHANYEEYFQNIGLLEYLVVYVACQKVLRENYLSATLINCDKNAFVYHSFNHNSQYYFIESLILKNRPQSLPHLIKLINTDRKMLTPYLLNKRFKENSLLDF